MRAMYRALATALAVFLVAVFAAPAVAHDHGSVKHKDKYLRAKVIALYGKRAPGCDLVAGKCRHHKHPTMRQVRKYFNTLRVMVMPRPAAQLVRVGSPRNPPAGTGTVNAGGTLEAIARCESGGDPTTNTGNGFYGKYQFTLSTWQSVGGSGNPAAASEAEQNKRAAMLYAREGASPWPVCGR